MIYSHHPRPTSVSSSKRHTPASDVNDAPDQHHSSAFQSADPASSTTSETTSEGDLSHESTQHKSRRHRGLIDIYV